MKETPQIEVLGTGCATCRKLHEITQKAADELWLGVSVAYVTDVQRIIAMGLMQSPVLAINGKPVLVGFTPDIEKIKKIIQAHI